MAEDKSGYEIALERIAAVRESMGTDEEIYELDLSQLNLKEIPSEISILKRIIKLNFSNNNLSKISGLDSLDRLEKLILYNNKIESINGVQKLEKLKELILNSNQIRSIGSLDSLVHLEKLDLGGNLIEKIENLEANKGLLYLVLFSNYIKKIENIEKLDNLMSLDLSQNYISEIENLDRLTNLTILDLSSNQISKIENLGSLINLRVLKLGGNKIIKIGNLEGLTNLYLLYLNNNQIGKIENLESLPNLDRLYLEDNQIINIFEIPERLIDKITDNTFHLKIDNNPFIGIDGISIEDYPVLFSANHNEQFKHDYYKFKPVEKVSYRKYQLPVKILLFGNSNVGKSDFSRFLREGKLVDPSVVGKSTDILEILAWKEEVQGKNYWIATIFDFGGQDFYHATYQMFYTTDCIFCILFEDASNVNEDAPHSESRLEDHQNYNLAYWLANVKYHLKKERQNERENNKNENKETTTTNPAQDAIYLIRNKMDLAPDSSSLSQALATMQQYQIFHRYDISLNIHEQQKYQRYRNILVDNIQMDIHKGRSIEMIESDISLLDYLFNFRERNENRNKIAVNELLSTANKELDYKINPLDFNTALRRLRKSGIILWYEQRELKDWIWLRPDRVVTEFHNLLNKEKIAKCNGRIPQFEYETNFNEIAELLKLYNISFLDRNFPEGPHYIIPQYLKKENQDDALFAIAQDGLEILFAVQFKDFMPHGLFNRLACFYGGLQDQKYYVKNKMIFTLNEVKVWLEIDPIQMRVIFKAGNTKSKEAAELKMYLFRSLIAAYCGYNPIVYKLYRFYFPKGHNTSRKNEKVIVAKAVLLERSGNQLQYKDWSSNPLAEKLNVEFKRYVYSSNVMEVYNNIESYFPSGLKVSLDNIYFAKCKELITVFENPKDHNNYVVLSNLDDKESSRKMYAAPFNPFMNKPLPMTKKIFISYSRQDVEYKDLLRDYLKILHTFEIADNWSCEDITIGNWHNQIQRELESSDLIIFMLSHNFFNSKYILEQEVKKTIDSIAEGRNQKVLCVIVKPIVGFEKIKNLKSEKFSPLQEAILKLGDHQYLPYKKDRNSTIVKDKQEAIVPLLTFDPIEEAMTQIVEKIIEALN